MRIMHRKQFAALAVGVLLPCLAWLPTAKAENQGWDAAYRSETHTLTVQGRLTGTDFLLLRIVPYQNAKTVLQESAAQESDLDIVKTIETNADRNIAASVRLPETYVGRRYIYRANAADDTKSGYLICANLAQVAATLPDVNRADAASAAAILMQLPENAGLDNGDTSKDMEYLTKLLVSFRPADGYTMEGFLASYMQCEGLAYVKQQVYTLEQMLEIYSVYFDSDYSSVYRDMNVSAQLALQKRFQSGLTGGSFNELFLENCFLAQYQEADSTESFRAILLGYLNENKISLADYNRIDNAYKQNQIIDELYRTRGSQESVSAVVAEFGRLVKAALADIGGGKGGGGRGPSSGGTGGSGASSQVAFDGAGGLPATPVTPGHFSDLNNHWSKIAVEAMVERGIVNGYTDGSFRPDRLVTRAEFAKMLSLLLNLSEGNTHEFADVVSDRWYAAYVSMAAEAGIVVGSDGYFWPETEITRQDAAVMLSRGLQYKQVMLNGGQGALYEDHAQIAGYATEAVDQLTESGILTGADGQFRPMDSMTRAEAATMLYRMLGLISE